VQPHNEIEKIFKSHVLEPLKKTLQEKVVVNTSVSLNSKSIHQNRIEPGNIPFRLCFAERSYGHNSLTMDHFLNFLQKERQYTPPIRFLFAGCDKAFNAFLTDYVTNILHAVPILAAENEFQDLTSVYQSRNSTAN
jgi:hypothetical protein